MHPKVDTKIGYFFEANDGPIFITKTWLQQNKNKPKMSQKMSRDIFFILLRYSKKNYSVFNSHLMLSFEQ